MSLGTCAELSRCLAAAAPLKPTSRNSNRAATITHVLRTPINGYTCALSVSTDSNHNHNSNRVVAAAGSGAQGLTYKDAGVDIDAGSELVRRIAKMAPGIGGFGGLFPLGDSYLVAGTDGVGTKVMLAFETGIHDTIGIDLVKISEFEFFFFFLL